MSRDKILLVEGDTDDRELVQSYLSRNGYWVITANNGKDALELVSREKPDLIILDVILPGIDGFAACRQIRKMTDAPVIFLSSKTEEADKITGLTIGGDDYMTKPFSPNELVARVYANLRRIKMLSGSGSPQTKINYKDLEIDLVSRTVRINGKIVHLSRKEFDLLVFLARHPFQLFSQEVLYREVWGCDSFNDSRTIIVHISNLRRKIEQDPSNPKYIINIHGVGYRLGST